MQEPHNLVALVTLFSLILFLATGMGVARARVKYGVTAPATTGDETFERHFRVQMNTLEQLVIFLPALWLFAIYWNDRVAALLGLIWLIGRVMYMTGYVADPKKRGAGFGIAGLASLVLLVGGLVGVGRVMMLTGV